MLSQLLPINIGTVDFIIKINYHFVNISGAVAIASFQCERNVIIITEEVGET